MGIGIRIENLRKVFDTPPPMARGVGFSYTPVRSGKKDKAPKKFELVALDGVSFEIGAGEIFGLLGPNGAGKSTTIGILTTRTRPTSGRAMIGEYDVWREQVKAKRLIGVVPQRPNLDFALSAREILTFHGAYFGQSARERERRADELLEKFKLTDRATHMVRTFSGGMMQRLSIARAMMHDPEVLFLDEPSAGLDPQTRLLLWEIIRDYNRLGKTIVLTTHYMDEADALCDAPGDHRSRPHHLPGYSRGIEGDDSGRLPFAPALRARHGRTAGRIEEAARRNGSALAGSGIGRCVRRSRRPVDRADRQHRAGGGLRTAGRAYCRAQPGDAVSASYGKELARLNWKTFFALLARDGHVARRNLLPTLLQNLLQPLLFTFVFGKVMTTSGMLPAAYKSMLLPGVMAISMVMAGVQAVAMPLITEFQFTREIEDRLLAPIEIGWLAVQKIVAGMIQAMAAGLVVIPAAWLIMGRGVNLDFGRPLEFLVVAMLVALFSSAGGLALGCSVGQTQIGLMFSLVLAPMMMFGCAYYPWSALEAFPILHVAVLVNPLVYASEGLRGALVPQVPHMNTLFVIGALAVIDLGLLYLGLRKFHQKAVS